MICKGCGVDKEQDAFYASNRSRCKECVKLGVRTNRAAHSEYYRAYDRQRYRERPERKAAARLSSASPAGVAGKKRYAEKIKHTMKRKAHNAVNNALRDGKLAKAEGCFFCAKTDGLQAHHPDYRRPFDVFWLCSACHGKLHTINGDFHRSRQSSNDEAA